MENFKTDFEKTLKKTIYLKRKLLSKILTQKNSQAKVSQIGKTRIGNFQILIKLLKKKLEN